MPPTDPVIYRLYEGVLVYGHAIKVSVSTYLTVTLNVCSRLLSMKRSINESIPYGGTDSFL